MSRARWLTRASWLVASEHLYNINNVALNSGSADMYEVPRSGAVATGAQ